MVERDGELSKQVTGKEDQDWTHRRRVYERRELIGVGVVALIEWRIAGIGWGIAG